MIKKSLVCVIFLILGSVVFYSCEKTVDYSGDINNLITETGHLNEPEEYAPTIQGEPVVTNTTISGVDYQVTTTNYKMAKKINSYKILPSSNKGVSSLKSTNDVYLGAIIQGKQWYENGYLTSIGDFERKPITLTVEGVVLANTNTIEVENPNNANVTDAINTLLESGYSSNPSTEYTFVKAEAYTKNQVGLELGFKPAWLGDMFGLNFSIENTVEKNTVIMYFKQKYYTIKVNLPGEPSDFFADNVDFEALKNRITSDNPAGYISSIDYGRVIIAKVTSSYSSTDIAASVNAAFQALSVNIGGHYQEVLGDCQFECQVLGGSGSPLVQDAQGVIDLINAEMVPESLFSARPIEYRVNYLDGSVFKIGDVVEYPVVEYSQTTENKNFDVIVHGFYVWHDCDFWSSGDFSYSLDINGHQLFQDNVSCEDDNFISINQTVAVSLPNAGGQKIIVSGQLKEDDELVKEFTKEFTFPWDDADLVNETWTISGTSTNLWEEYLYRASDCDASLLFEIVKK